MYGEGISREGDLLDIAVNNGLLEKSGAWYSYKGERIGQGRENARQFLKDNKDTMAKLDTEVRKHLGLIPASPVATVAAGAPAGTPQQQQGARVTTMPSAVPEPAKVPATRR
jgi:recombination protein RecA